MTRLARAVLVACSLVSGCELVAGTSNPTANPVNTANALPGYGDGGSASRDLGRIRIADLAMTPGHADFCVRASGRADWGEPVLFNSGTDSFFRTGLSYPQVTIPFAAPSGEIDVKFIAAGDTCASLALSEGDSIPVGAPLANATGAVASPVVTIVRYGGNASATADGGIAENVVGLPEESSVDPTCPAGACPRFRLVNAAASREWINAGVTVSGARTLPTAIESPLFDAPVAPGHAPSPQPLNGPLGRIDSSGYATAIDAGGSGQSGLTLGIVESDGDASVDGSAGGAAVAIFQPSSIPDTQTLFFIGDPSNNVHPLQGLLVEDDVALGGPNGDGGSEWLAKSTLTTPATLSIDTFNAALSGLDVPYDSVRDGPIVAALAARTTDVVCVLDVDFDSDKVAIATAAAAGNFPYAYWIPTTITTPPTSSLDWFGNTPPAITTAACAAESATTLAGAVACASQCSVGPDDDPDAAASSTACLETACADQLIPLVDDYPCLDCLEEYLSSSYPIDFSVGECASDSNDPYGQYDFGGQNGTMILSRFPFAKTDDGGTDDKEAYVLPGSNFRRVALRARLQLPAATELDVYCGDFTSWQNSTVLFEYVGQYASPDAGLYDDENDNDDGWRDEDNLQARDFIAWVEAESSGRPAVVAGEWNAGPGSVGDGGAPLLESYAPEVFEQFVNAGFVPAHPVGYVPECTSCNANPYNEGAPITTDGTTGWDSLTTLLYNFPAGSTSSESIWNSDPTEWNVAIPGFDAGFPLSTEYPRNVTVLLP